MDVIGPYKITNRIFHDRYVMYEGYHLHLQNPKKVAIRLIDSYSIIAPYFLTKLGQVAGINHNCIVPIYDFGEVDKYYYIVTRLMLGGALSEKISSDSLQESDILQIIYRIANGLDFAHQNGFIHGDITWSNIFFDINNVAYLSDFSASVINAEMDIENWTEAIRVMDFSFASPEQVFKHTITPFTDFYQLGVNVYAMLTGSLPTFVNTPIDSISFKESISLETRSFWISFIKKTLSKTPKQGFNNAKSLLEYIRNHPRFSAAL